MEKESILLSLVCVGEIRECYLEKSCRRGSKMVCSKTSSIPPDLYILEMCIFRSVGRGHETPIIGFITIHSTRWGVQTPVSVSTVWAKLKIDWFHKQPTQTTRITCHPESILSSTPSLLCTISNLSCGRARGVCGDGLYFSSPRIVRYTEGDQSFGRRSPFLATWKRRMMGGLKRGRETLHYLQKPGFPDALIRIQDPGVCTDQSHTILLSFFRVVSPLLSTTLYHL